VVAEHLEAGADDVLFARVDKGRQLGVGDRVGKIVVLVYEQNGLHTKQAISLLLCLMKNEKTKIVRFQFIHVILHNSQSLQFI